MSETPTDSGQIDVESDGNDDWLHTLAWDLPTDPAYFTQEQLVNLSTLPAWEAAPDEIKNALGDDSKTKPQEVAK